MIILDHVSKHYQTRDNKDFVAVEPTSLEIKQGEIFGLMGYSGAGKSTLLRLINLLERPDTGIVSVCGQELTALNATQLRHARQNIGMVFQQFNLLSNRTVAENVAFPLEIAKWPSKKIQARVEECLEIVDLQDRANHYPSQLSGGQKAKLLLLKLVLDRPNVLLLDEPTRNFSPTSQPQVRQLLATYPGAIITVSHDRIFLKEVCQKIYRLTEEGLEEVEL